MRVLVLGANGYIGWPLMLRLQTQGHDVVGVDSYIKQKWERFFGVHPVASISDRDKSDITDINVVDTEGGLYDLMTEFNPDTVYHLAEQPSAPMSMYGRRAAVETQTNNVLGTLNLMFSVMHAARVNDMRPAHIIKIGTMGEYGTPDCEIGEGWLEYQGERFLFPKRPGSFYHLSKVHDSHNLEYGCRVWGMAVTDVNQGIVWGSETEEAPFEDKTLRTSVHADPIFGTVVNRFIMQAIAGVPLTVYGTGDRRRGFIHLSDTIDVLIREAMCPAAPGEFRVINQLTDVRSIAGIANDIASLTGARIDNVCNPRVEDDNKTYKVQLSFMDKLVPDAPQRKLSAEQLAAEIMALQGSVTKGRAKRVLSKGEYIKWAQKS